MTVAELIKKLQKMPQDKYVYIFSKNGKKLVYPYPYAKNIYGEVTKNYRGDTYYVILEAGGRR